MNASFYMVSWLALMIGIHYIVQKKFNTSSILISHVFPNRWVKKNSKTSIIRRIVLVQHLFYQQTSLLECITYHIMCHSSGSMTSILQVKKGPKTMNAYGLTCNENNRANFTHEENSSFHCGSKVSFFLLSFKLCTELHTSIFQPFLKLPIKSGFKI